MPHRLPAFAALLFLTLSAAAQAAPVRFDGDWTEQRFSFFSSNDFLQDGKTLRVDSDGTVSLLWRALTPSRWGSRRATWNWEVSRSVSPTDLTRKGGDDRNLSLYFVFLPEHAAAGTSDQGIASLLGNEQARVLMYVWGGDHAPDAVLPSPYLGDRGRTLTLRRAGTGAASERVDLVRDHRRAFGEAPGQLVGLAVSGDSDDTGGRVTASISDLRIE